MLPWPLFVNPGLYTSKCLSMKVELENGSCDFFHDLFKVKVKVKCIGTTSFHLYFISLHIETKMSCLKGVNAFSVFANCHSMKEIRKTTRKNGFGEL